MYDKLFTTDIGRRIYESAEAAVKDNSMNTYLSGGVAVGFSGGADSVMLLHFLLEYRKNNFDFTILPVHVNHMIRGSAADKDEQFCESICEKLGLEFVSVKRDVPRIAADSKTGLEEAARKERYLIFEDIIRGRNDISAVAVAHNSTDNLETVIFNMMRGAGLFGLSGIAPIRDNIIRPLINVSSQDIRKALELVGIEYALDATNFDTDYTRNYIRHEILPKLNAISENPEAAMSKTTHNVRDAAEFISAYSAGLLNGRKTVGRCELVNLPKAPLVEVVKQMYGGYSDKMLEAVHFNAISSNLYKDDFSVSLPDGLSFVCERGICRITRLNENFEFLLPIHSGVNDFPEYSAKIFVDTEKTIEIYSNVYKFSIQVALPFDIIKGELFIRNKLDGDAYHTSGMTKKVKRMLCDAGIPKSIRSKIPIFCDNEGILWIPGLKPRDSVGITSDKKVYLTLAITDLERDDRFFAANIGSFPHNV